MGGALSGQSSGQRLVAVGHFIPVVEPGALEREAAALQVGGGVGLRGGDQGGDVVGVGPVAAGVAQDLPVEGHVEGVDGGSRADGPQQRRVGAAHGVAVVVDERPGVQLVEQLLVPDPAQEPYARVGQGLDPAGVLIGVGGGADERV